VRGRGHGDARRAGRLRTALRAAAACLALGAAVACRPEGREPASGRALTREEFIETYVALLRVTATAADSADARARRAAVLQRRGIAPRDLERFARRYQDDPRALAEIWEEIERRLRTPEPPDDAAGPP
jgi:hypothetical protein